MPERKALIIDDNRAMRNATQEILISRGWEVAMVTTQAEGLMLLRDYDPDWIIVAREQLEGTGERFMHEVQSLSPRNARGDPDGYDESRRAGHVWSTQSGSPVQDSRHPRRRLSDV